MEVSPSTNSPTPQQVAVEQQPNQTEIFSDLRNTLAPDGAGNVHEEQLQHAVVLKLLGEGSSEAASTYNQAFSQARTQGLSNEDAVKAALSVTVDEEKITQEVAEQINGVSFRAAQLDDNHSALFDNRGSANDHTIAVKSKDEAIAMAEAVIQKIKSGEIEAGPRALNAPSNTIGGTSSVSASGGSVNAAGLSTTGFLWKPVSESDGKLVVLLPPSFTGHVQSAAIYSDLPPSAGTFIEEGRFSGDRHNGGRAHFRFDNSGRNYPDNSYLVAKLSDGTKVPFQIGNSSSRNTT